MKVLITYLLLLLLISSSIQTCKADDYDDWKDDEDSFIFDTPVKRSSIIKSSEEEDTPKLIVTICNYDDKGNYYCKDLP